MQKLKIYAQKTKNGNLDYYTNLYRKDIETGKTIFKKLRVGFKKEQEVTGHITINSSSLTFNKVKLPMKLQETGTNKMVNVEVPFTAYKLYIWEYEKTLEDKQKDEEDENNGVKFIKEYIPEEERKSRFNKQSSESSTSFSNTEVEVQEDLEGLELPF